MAASNQQAIEQAFRRDPSDRDAFDTLHDLYTADERHDLLAELCELRASALSDDQQACELLEQAADLHAALGDSAAERRAINKIVVRNPRSLTALQRQQELAAPQQRWEELLRAMLLELEAWGEDSANQQPVAEIHFRMGQVWEQHCHRLDRALDHYQRAVSFPQTPCEWIEAVRKIHLSAGQWTEAANLYRMELQRRGDDPHRLPLLGKLARLLHHRLADLEGAAALYEEALPLAGHDSSVAEVLADLYASPEWPNPGGLERASRLLSQLAQQRHDQGDDEGAIDYLRRALGADPESDAAFGQLEQAYQRTQRWRDLERLYEQRSALGTEADTVRMQLQRGQLLEQHVQDPEAALACYESIVSRSPSTKAATDKLHELCRSQQDYKKLLSHIDRELQAPQAPSGQVALLMEAVSIHRDELDNPHAAAHLLRQVLELDPDHQEALEAYSQYFERRSDYQSLAELRHFAIEAAAEHGGPSEQLRGYWEQLADIYEHHLGDSSAAEHAWQQLQQLCPDDQGVSTRLQRLAARRERAEALTRQVTSQLDRAATLCEQAQLVESRAQQLHDQGTEHATLIPLLRLAAEHGKGNAFVLRLLIELYRKHSDAEGLAWALRRQLDDDPSRTDRIRILRELADVFSIQLQRYKDALWAYEQVVQLAPGDDSAFEALHTLLRDNDDFEQLAAVLRRRAESAPSTKQRIEALKRLAHLMQDDLASPAEAVVDWEAILQLRRNDREALEALSVWYERAGYDRELFTVIQRRLDVCTLPAERIPLLRTIGQLARRRLNRPDQALAAYEQILGLLPGDRESLAELTAIYEQLDKSEELAATLHRSYETAEDRDNKLSLAFRMADVLEDKLTDSERAIALYEQILGDLDPGNLEAHQRLKLLEIGRGQYEAAIKIAERELFLIGNNPHDDARTLELATEVADLWRDQIHQPQQAALAFERVLALSTDVRGVIEALRQLYVQCESYLPLVELAPALSDQLRDTRERELLYIDTGKVWEEQLGDGEQAFNWYRRAYRLCGDHSVANEHLRRVASTYRLWTELLAVYEEARQSTGDPQREHALLLRIADISRDQLDMPEHAFVALEEAIALDPGGSGEQLEQLVELAAQTGQSRALLPVYEQMLAQTIEHPQRDALYGRMIELAELTLSDIPLTLRLHLRRFREFLQHQQADGLVVARVEEIDRVCASSDDWRSALSAREAYLRSATTDEQRLFALRDLGRLYETQLNRADRAFSARIHALMLAPDAPGLLEDLVRAGHRLLQDSTPPLHPVSLFDPAELISAGDLDPRLKLSPRGRVKAIDSIATDPQPGDGHQASGRPPAHPDGAAGGVAAPSARAQPQPLPIDISATSQVPTLTSIASDLGLAQSVSLEAGSPWDWIEEAYRLLAARGDPAEAPRHLSTMARIWSDEGGDPAKALAVLCEAATSTPADSDLLDQIERVGCTGQHHELMWQCLEQLIDGTEDEQAQTDIHRRLARTMHEHGQLERAEPHLAAVAELDPADEATITSMRALYAQQGRWIDLAALLAHQLDRTDQADPGASDTTSQRDTLIEDLVQIYDQRLDNAKAAARLLARLGKQRHGDRDLHLRLGQLYQRSGAWTHASQTLQHAASLTPDDEQRSRLLLSVARIYEDELELADDAITAYEQTAKVAAAAPEAHEVLEHALQRLEHLYETHNRSDELIRVLEHRRLLAYEHPAVARDLLCRRAAVLQRVGRPAEAAEDLERARALDAGDLKLTRDLANALRAAGQPQQAVSLLKEQAAGAQQRDEDPQQVADLYLSAARIMSQDLDDEAGCEWTLGLAVKSCATHADSLTELAASQRRLQAWDDYAATMVRLCRLIPDANAAMTKLLVTAQALTELCPDGAIDLYEQALERSPDSVSALDALIDLSRDPARRLQLIRSRLSQTKDPSRKASLLVELGKIEEYRETPADEIAATYREALKEVPDFIPALDSLSRLLVGHGQLDASLTLLQDALARLSGAKNASQAGPLYYRLGSLLERLGRDEEGYRFLIDARRLMPRSLPVQLALGQNRFRAHRWREALRHLGTAAEHPDSSRYSEFVAEALFSAGRCERMLRRPTRATVLFERALEFDPGHAGALREAAESALAAGQYEQAASTMDKLADRSKDPKERVTLLRTAADLYLDRLSSPDQAAHSYQRLADSVIGVHPLPIDPEEREPLLRTMLPVLEAGGRHLTAAAVARSIAQLTLDAGERQAHLLMAGDQYEAAGAWSAADVCRREVLTHDPQCHGAVAGLARSFEAAGDTAAVVALLEAHLATPPTTEDTEDRLTCGQMYLSLAQGHEAKNDPLSAIRALEQSLRCEDSTETRLHLAELYKAQPQLHRAALANYQVLGRDVSQVEALRALAEASATSAPYRNHCLSRVLELMEQDNATRPVVPPGYEPPQLEVDAPYPGTLGEAPRRAAFSVARETVMHEVLMTLWGAASIFLTRRLTDYGASSQSRISPLEDSNVAKVFSHVARAFDVKTAGLFLRQDEEASGEIAVTATAPAGLIISGSTAASDDVDRLRFLIGRALHLSQPPLLLAVAMERVEFAQLLTAVLRAFHPRHMRGRDISPQALQKAERLRSSLPYKVSRRLGELFREHPDARFDSAAWRRAAWQSGNRAGLTACGDLQVALMQVRAEDPSTAELALYPAALNRSAVVRDLLTFAASETYYSCRASLGLADPPSSH